MKRSEKDREASSMCVVEPRDQIRQMFPLPVVPMRVRGKVRGNCSKRPLQKKKKNKN